MGLLCLLIGWAPSELNMNDASGSGIGSKQEVSITDLGTALSGLAKFQVSLGLIPAPQWDQELCCRQLQA